MHLLFMEMHNSFLFPNFPLKCPATIVKFFIITSEPPATERKYIFVNSLLKM